MRIPQGGEENIIINLANHGARVENQFATIVGVEVETEDGRPAEGFELEYPPPENFQVGWEIVQANWYLPVCEPVISPEQPPLPPELENFYDYYSLYKENFWVPAREVRIRVRVGENVPRGLYKVKVAIRATAARPQEGTVGGSTTTEASPWIQVLGPPPPSPPIPMKFAILLVLVVLFLIPVLHSVLKKRRVRI
ncbi:MAG: hypothetical protein QXG14_05195 [Candidatus Hadarchaeales archaeon]